jgi:hypothetical protein
MLLQNQQNFHNKDDKLLAKVTGDLERFKQPFFILIDRAQEKLHELEAERKMVPKFDDSHHKLMDIECGILSKLIIVYKKFANSYILDLSIAKNNPETLSKLYMITFTKLQEIQIRLAQIIPQILYNARDSDKKDQEKAIYLLHYLMLDYSRAKPIREFEHMLDGLEYYGLGEEFKPVMDMLLKQNEDDLIAAHSISFKKMTRDNT